jgi:hypothetical protein
MGTASAGSIGSINNQTSDVSMTQRNTNPYSYIQPPSNTTTQKTRQSLYQGITNGSPTGMGLLAPQSTSATTFNYYYTSGFPAPQPRAVYGGGSIPVYACGAGVYVQVSPYTTFTVPTGPVEYIPAPIAGIPGACYGGCYGAGYGGGYGAFGPSGVGVAVSPGGVSLDGSYGSLGGGVSIGACGASGSLGGCFGGFGSGISGCFGF